MIDAIRETHLPNLSRYPLASILKCHLSGTQKRVLLRDRFGRLSGKSPTVRILNLSHSLDLGGLPPSRVILEMPMLQRHHVGKHLHASLNQKSRVVRFQRIIFAHGHSSIMGHLDAFFPQARAKLEQLMGHLLEKNQRTTAKTHWRTFVGSR